MRSSLRKLGRLLALVPWSRSLNSHIRNGTSQDNRNPRAAVCTLPRTAVHILNIISCRNISCDGPRGALSSSVTLGGTTQYGSSETRRSVVRRSSQRQHKQRQQRTAKTRTEHSRYHTYCTIDSSIATPRQQTGRDRVIISTVAWGCRHAPVPSGCPRTQRGPQKTAYLLRTSWPGAPDGAHQAKDRHGCNL